MFKWFKDTLDISKVSPEQVAAILSGNDLPSKAAGLIPKPSGSESVSLDAFLFRVVIQAILPSESHTSQSIITTINGYLTCTLEEFIPHLYISYIGKTEQAMSAKESETFLTIRQKSIELIGETDSKQQMLVFLDILYFFELKQEAITQLVAVINDERSNLNKIWLRFLPTVPIAVANELPTIVGAINSNRDVLKNWIIGEPSRPLLPAETSIPNPVLNTLAHHNFLTHQTNPALQAFELITKIVNLTDPRSLFDDFQSAWKAHPIVQRTHTTAAIDLMLGLYNEHQELTLQVLCDEALQQHAKQWLLLRGNTKTHHIIQRNCAALVFALSLPKEIQAPALDYLNIPKAAVPTLQEIKKDLEAFSKASPAKKLAAPINAISHLQTICTQAVSVERVQPMLASWEKLFKAIHELPDLGPFATHLKVICPASCAKTLDMVVHLNHIKDKIPQEPILVSDSITCITQIAEFCVASPNPVNTKVILQIVLHVFRLIHSLQPTKEELLSIYHLLNMILGETTTDIIGLVKLLTYADNATTLINQHAEHTFKHITADEINELSDFTQTLIGQIFEFPELTEVPVDSISDMQSNFSRLTPRLLGMLDETLTLAIKLIPHKAIIPHAPWFSKISGSLPLAPEFSKLEKLQLAAITKYLNTLPSDDATTSILKSIKLFKTIPSLLLPEALGQLTALLCESINTKPRLREQFALIHNVVLLLGGYERSIATLQSLDTKTPDILLESWTLYSRNERQQALKALAPLPADDQKQILDLCANIIPALTTGASLRTLLETAFAINNAHKEISATHTAIINLSESLIPNVDADALEAPVRQLLHTLEQLYQDPNFKRAIESPHLGTLMQEQPEWGDIQAIHQSLWPLISTEEILISPIKDYLTHLCAESSSAPTMIFSVIQLIQSLPKEITESVPAISSLIALTSSSLNRGGLHLKRNLAGIHWVISMYDQESSPGLARLVDLAHRLDTNSAKKFMAVWPLTQSTPVNYAAIGTIVRTIPPKDLSTMLDCIGELLPAFSAQATLRKTINCALTYNQLAPHATDALTALSELSASLDINVAQQALEPLVDQFISKLSAIYRHDSTPALIASLEHIAASQPELQDLRIIHLNLWPKLSTDMTLPIAHYLAFICKEEARSPTMMCAFIELIHSLPTLFDQPVALQSLMKVIGSSLNRGSEVTRRNFAGIHWMCMQYEAIGGYEHLIQEVRQLDTQTPQRLINTWNLSQEDNPDYIQVGSSLRDIPESDLDVVLNLMGYLAPVLNHEATLRRVINSGLEFNRVYPRLQHLAHCVQQLQTKLLLTTSQTDRVFLALPLFAGNNRSILQEIFITLKAAHDDGLSECITLMDTVMPSKTPYWPCITNIHQHLSPAMTALIESAPDLETLLSRAKNAHNAPERLTNYIRIIKRLPNEAKASPEAIDSIVTLLSMPDGHKPCTGYISLANWFAGHSTGYSSILTAVDQVSEHTLTTFMKTYDEFRNQQWEQLVESMQSVSHEDLQSILNILGTVAPEPVFQALTTHLELCVDIKQATQITEEQRKRLLDLVIKKKLLTNTPEETILALAPIIHAQENNPSIISKLVAILEGQPIDQASPSDSKLSQLAQQIGVFNADNFKTIVHWLAQSKQLLDPIQVFRQNLTPTQTQLRFIAATMRTTVSVMWQWHTVSVKAQQEFKNFCDSAKKLFSPSGATGIHGWILNSAHAVYTIPETIDQQINRLTTRLSSETKSKRFKFFNIFKKLVSWSIHLIIHDTDLARIRIGSSIFFACWATSLFITSFNPASWALLSISLTLSCAAFIGFLFKMIQTAISARRITKLIASVRCYVDENILNKDAAQKYIAYFSLLSAFEKQPQNQSAPMYSKITSTKEGRAKYDKLYASAKKIKKLVQKLKLPPRLIAAPLLGEGLQKVPSKSLNLEEILGYMNDSIFGAEKNQSTQSNRMRNPS